MKILLVYEDESACDRTMADKDRLASMARSLGEAGFDPFICGVRGIDGLLDFVGAASPHLVFSSARAMRLRDGSMGGVHSTLDRVGAAYVGSVQGALDLAISKPAMKAVWRDAGVPTPDWAEARADGDDPRRPGTLVFPAGPWIVKPSMDGNSRGIDFDAVIEGGREFLDDRIERLRAAGTGAIVEHFVGSSPDFMEFTVAMIGDPEGGAYLPAEIHLERAEGPRAVTFRDKADGVAVARPVDDMDRRTALRAFARRAVLATGLRDYARCDVVFAEGRYQALEVNGQPMLPDPWFSACGAAAGLDPEDEIALVFDAALRRLRGSGRKLPPDPSRFEERVASAIAKLEKPS